MNYSWYKKALALLRSMLGSSKTYEINFMLRGALLMILVRCIGSTMALCLNSYIFLSHHDVSNTTLTPSSILFPKSKVMTYLWSLLTLKLAIQQPSLPKMVVELNIMMVEFSYLFLFSILVYLPCHISNTCQSWPCFCLMGSLSKHSNWSNFDLYIDNGAFSHITNDACHLHNVSQ